jgi:CheY-like chemotaxis protein
MPPPASFPHILVIDGAPHILALFHAALQRAGYRVSTDRLFTGIESLLAAIKAAPPDLIILELIIREEDLYLREAGRGWRLLEGLKLDRETRQIPVIVTTAAVDLVDHLQPRLDKMGARVLRRPFHIAHLVELTAAALGRNANAAPGKRGRRRASRSRGGGEPQSSRDAARR